MSWPPEGSTPPVPPRPAPAQKPRSERLSRPASPGETEGETRVKPQAKPTGPTPPQFQHDGIDPMRAALILGLPLLAAGVTLLVLFASTTVWWIAAGVAAAGVTGGVVLRRSRRARRLLRRVPGAGRAASALRRTANGRFAQSPLGRVLRSRTGGPSGGRPGGSPARPRTLGGRLRSMLPSWAGGTRKPSSSTRPGGPGGSSSGGRSGGRMRSLLSRLKPGGGRRPGSTGGASGGRPGKPGGASQSGAKQKPGSLLRRAARSVVGASGRASRAVGSKLLRIRPAASPSGTSKPKGKGKNKPSGGGSGNGSSLDLGVVWTGAGKAGRLVGRGAGALLKRWRQHQAGRDDDFDPYSTYETGIEGEVVNGKHTDPELGEIAARARKAAAKRAKKIAKQRAKQAKQPKPEPEWPNVEPHDGSWPTTEPEDGVAPSAPPVRELPAERDHDPPPSPPVSPPPHRETTREAPRITSTNTGGRAMAISPTKYNDLITNASSRTQGWQAAADAFRRDSAELNEKAKDHDGAADVFDQAGNHAEAEKRRDDARQLRDDANTCLTYAAKMQEKANAEASAA